MFKRAMSTTPITDAIRRKVSEAFRPTVLEIENDSHKHAHHAPMRGSTNIAESHFRLVIVSDQFEGKNLPARHRMVYSLLDEEMKQENGVHALQLTTRTPKEYQ